MPAMHVHPDNVIVYKLDIGLHGNALHFLCSRWRYASLSCNPSMNRGGGEEEEEEEEEEDENL